MTTGCLQEIASCFFKPVQNSALRRGDETQMALLQLKID